MKFTLTQTAQIYISKWGHVNKTSWIFLGHIVVILSTLMTFCMIVLLVFNNLSDSLTSANKNVCMYVKGEKNMTTALLGHEKKQMWKWAYDVDVLQEWRSQSNIAFRAKPKSELR